MSRHADIFKERLKALREEAKLTQDQLGAAIGTSKVQISRYEAGRGMPNAENLVLLADALNCSLDYLLGRSESPREERKSDPQLRSVERALLKALRGANVPRSLQLVGMLLDDAMAVSANRWIKAILADSRSDIPREQLEELRLMVERNPIQGPTAATISRLFPVRFERKVSDE